MLTGHNEIEEKRAIALISLNFSTSLHTIIFPKKIKTTFKTMVINSKKTNMVQIRQNIFITPVNNDLTLSTNRMI